MPTPIPLAAPVQTPIYEADSADPIALFADPPLRPFDYTVVNSTPPRRVPNAVRTFWVADGVTGERREIMARLRVQTEHAAMWVQEDVWHDVRQLEEAALVFETQLYPSIRAVFGSEWTPGVDNDPHIHILHVAGLGEGVLGYTSSADEFPQTLYPFSNEAELIVVNIAEVEIASPAYYALLARQFQRLVQWFQDRNEEPWVKEGLADLAVWLSGFDVGAPERVYLQVPDVSLISWDGADVAHRGAAYLFAVYFYEHFGDEGVRALMAQPLDGIAGFNAALAELDTGLDFEDLFAGWLAANILDGTPGYGYTALEIDPAAPVAACEDYPFEIEGTVQQFGADYIMLRGDRDLRIHFTGAPTTPWLGVYAHSGSHLWWSNRADESRTMLTRVFDLSAVERATLIYWVRYEIETGYDYAVVEISADGGQHWQALRTAYSTDGDPLGNNPGWGYTGESGGWVRERVDLTPYAGGEVWVRFSYLTDEAITGAGLFLDDIAIPEIGYADDVESGEGGWEAAGFVRAGSAVPQRYLALLIGLGDSATVERLPIAEDQTAEWSAPLASRGWRGALLVISGQTPVAGEPARYQLAIEPANSP